MQRNKISKARFFALAITAIVLSACSNANHAPSEISVAAAGSRALPLTLTNIVAQPIPDDAASFVESTLEVLDASLMIKDLRVFVDITHTAIGDLEITLFPPSGPPVILHANHGYLSNNLRTWYGTTSESFDSLEALSGQSAAGTWTLRVFDSLAFDSGTLHEWSLAINEMPDLTVASLGFSNPNPTVGDLVYTTINIANSASVPARDRLLGPTMRNEAVESAWGYRVDSLYDSAQSFVADRDVLVTAAEVHFRTSETMDLSTLVQVSLQRDAGGVPSGVALTSVSDIIPIISGWQVVDFTVGAMLTAGAPYWLVAETTGPQSFTWAVTTQDKFSGGTCAYKQSGFAWVACSGSDTKYDMRFRLRGRGRSVVLYDGDPDTDLNDIPLDNGETSTILGVANYMSNLTAGGTTLVVLPWDTTNQNGAHTLYAWVDPGDSLLGPIGTVIEISESNNITGADITVSGLCTPIGGDDNCNGIDEDCNGTPDDGYVVTTTSCGFGPCVAGGSLTCQNGVEVDSCVPDMTKAAPDDITCDNVDDDCDGAIDEEWLPSQTCGFGPCQVDEICTVTGVTCTPDTTKAAADDLTCDDVDDDCNGAVDDGYVGVATNCGVGACAASGLTTCETGGVLGDSCTPGTPAADDSTCDDVDDDCNGSTDDGYVSVATNCGVGACTATGATSCDPGGVIVDSCTPGTPATDDTTCDDVDDDCNGFTDDGYVSVATNCGVGACAASGLTTCETGGVLGDSCTPGTPAADDLTCDDVDDDCNGTADDGYIGVATNCGVGACAATGVTTCEIGGALGDTCTPGTPAADDATCDDVDDDCNGSTDDGYVSVATNCGVGACAASGITSCDPGGVIVDSCTPGIAPSADDITCDDVDDDCNGIVDDGYVGIATNCGVGACATSGTTACDPGGVLVDSCTPGTPAPDDATCDNVDDDCNGAPDDGYVQTSTTCAAGSCLPTGMLSCVGGSEVDSCDVQSCNPADHLILNAANLSGTVGQGGILLTVQAVDSAGVATLGALDFKVVVSSTLGGAPAVWLGAPGAGAPTGSAGVSGTTLEITGAATVSVTDALAENVAVRLYRIDGVNEVQDDALMLRFLPAEADHLLLTAMAAANAACLPAMVNIETVDFYGNRTAALPVDPLTIDLDVAGPAGSTPLIVDCELAGGATYPATQLSGEMATGDAGQAAVEVAMDVPANLTLSARADALPRYSADALAKATATVVFEQRIDPLGSELHADAVTMIAGGDDAVTLTLTLRDNCGVVMNGAQAVEFSASQGLLSDVSGADGIYTATLTVTESECPITIEVDATADDIPIAAVATIDTTCYDTMTRVSPRSGCGCATRSDSFLWSWLVMLPLVLLRQRRG